MRPNTTGLNILVALVIEIVEVKKKLGRKGVEEGVFFLCDFKNSTDNFLPRAVLAKIFLKLKKCTYPRGAASDTTQAPTHRARQRTRSTTKNY